MGYKLADGSDSEQYKTIGIDNEKAAELISDQFIENGGFAVMSINGVKFKARVDSLSVINGRSLELEGFAIDLHEESNRKPFTKSDLKDGMKCETVSGQVYYVCGSVLRNKRYLTIYDYLSCYDDNLRYIEDQYGTDIIRVTDRDGTVVFEREPEIKEVVIRATDAQIQRLKELGYIK